MQSKSAPPCPSTPLGLDRGQQASLLAGDLQGASNTANPRRSGPARRRFGLALLLGAGLLAAGCEQAEPEPDEVGLSLFALNYTDVPIGVFYVNGTWGGNSSPYAAGLSTAGSIGLPRQWRPGIKVTVKWRDDRLYAIDKNALMTAEVEVPEYGKLTGGFLLVAFWPEREVKVYASESAPAYNEEYVPPGVEAYPYGLRNPGRYCQEQPGCMEWYRSGFPPREGHY